MWSTLRYILPDPEELSDPFPSSCVIDYVFAGDAPYRKAQADTVRRIMTHNLACLKSANPSIPLIQGFLTVAATSAKFDALRPNGI
jgi:hypothetical protein